MWWLLQHHYLSYQNLHSEPQTQVYRCSWEFSLGNKWVILLFKHYEMYWVFSLGFPTDSHIYGSEYSCSVCGSDFHINPDCVSNNGRYQWIPSIHRWQPPRPKASGRSPGEDPMTWVHTCPGREPGTSGWQERSNVVSFFSWPWNLEIGHQHKKRSLAQAALSLTCPKVVPNTRLQSSRGTDQWKGPEFWNSYLTFAKRAVRSE